MYSVSFRCMHMASRHKKCIKLLTSKSAFSFPLSTTHVHNWPSPAGNGYQSTLCFQFSMYIHTYCSSVHYNSFGMVYSVRPSQAMVGYHQQSGRHTQCIRVMHTGIPLEQNPNAWLLLSIILCRVNSTSHTTHSLIPRPHPREGKRVWWLWDESSVLVLSCAPTDYAKLRSDCSPPMRSCSAVTFLQ